MSENPVWPDCGDCGHVMVCPIEKITRVEECSAYVSALRNKIINAIKQDTPHTLRKYGISKAGEGSE